MTDTKKLLADRQETHGQFVDVAYVAQNIKKSMRNSRNWNDLADDTKEGLELIATKIARILSGNPNFADNFADIAGYAELMERQCVEILTP